MYRGLLDGIFESQWKLNQTDIFLELFPVDPCPLKLHNWGYANAYSVTQYVIM